jgi:DNA-binding transcriptional LysR family regulator
MESLRDIDVRLLRAFVAVADTGRMTTAARVVNLSQGAVSQQIKRLETLFDCLLFRRDADLMRLTREGERLMVRAQRLIALNDEIVNEMRAAEFSGEVRLGVPHDLVAMLMPPILRVFRQAHPNVLVTLVSDTSRSLAAQLIDGGIDLTLLTESKLGARDHRLLTDRLVWVGAKGGDAQSRRPLPVALGNETCAFRASAVQALTKAGIEWRAICQVGSLEPVFATLEADMAIAAFLSRTVPERLDVIDDGTLPKLSQHLISLRTSPSGISAVAQELARHIREGFERRYT